MNDRHPSGTMTPAPASDAASAPYASYGSQEVPYGDVTSYGGYDATYYGTGEHAAGTFAADPLFGSMPGEDPAQAAWTTGQWTAGAQDTGHYDAYAFQQAAYGTGGQDATAWTTGEQPMAGTPQQGGSPETGQWDASAWLQPDHAEQPADPTQQWNWGTQTFDSGVYDATQWNSDGGETPAPDAQYGGEPYGQEQFGTQEDFAAHENFAAQEDFTRESFSREPYEQDAPDQPYAEDAYRGEPGPDEPGAGEPADTGELPAVSLLDEQEEVTPAPRAASRSGSRSRRRTPPKRSALLTVAVPSACVMGVAGIAAASVGDLSDEGGQDARTTAADAQPVQPSAANVKLDTQLESLAAGADDFADRASRAQGRIDLKAQQELERKRAAEEAARKERLRPKFALPVAQHGLSAFYGQSGINWMSLHTGIDFPVSYGTPVLAATDGTVRTQYNSAYGNMLIVTAMDGTETWYCHLSSYQVPSGATVKAGDQIAFSGNSGNSTGPHLHFEVRPGGGSSIDPLPWFRSHGLEPT
ncbi:peptidoglycan DD-metalloendopeptidase family protein [Streptomyces cellulosae]|uniref:Peptidoglycan DD-metalloendopeptidase family protein n=2 Tax=Streptomyces TaxID=1883 RepID=A0ABU3JAK7_9ACTN|nr:peptidoglycan DD-metalloendopeptidase family protein [Streptomyces sp. McG7]MBT2904025.1 peptidoglycan DD-metalloendopeptidase family protein [Streptomyces sp. McG8]MDQ0489152.1 murein DD-endopeptidase MepM/ murein hydrolase activator NlpD [Streptomyces thermodiastaticus]MDT6972091.1 peptidoglycan DD-metalloendopeptidase family protein [Streptomyces thermocarboxydus]THC47695.1 M23 family peptidase [Streptomyces sp. Akac8]WSB43108.1 peptidoglycan DD-metalloendopeptidase family protein [Strep